MTKSNTVVSVADVLEREVEPTIKEWLRRVNLVPELTHIPLSDKDRTGHLPQALLRPDCPPAPCQGCPTARLHRRCGARTVTACQGYSAPMLIEESRVFQVATFGTLHLHQSELDQDQVLLDIMVIADEVDAQLMETVRSLMGTQLAEATA